MYFEGNPHYKDFIFKQFLGLFGINIIPPTSQNIVHLILAFNLGFWALKLRFSKI